METNNMIQLLTKKKQELTSELQKVDAALKALQDVNKLLFPELTKHQIVRKTSNSVRYSLEVPHPCDFAISLIRKLGKEIPAKAIFQNYLTETNRKFATQKEHDRAYYAFYQALAGTGKKRGLVKKVYKLKGVGKEAYFNVDSAILLQKEKTVQNPNVDITNVR